MQHNLYRVQIVGATGYGGLGLIEQLMRHPNIELTSLLAKTDTGMPLSKIFPHLTGFCDHIVEEVQDERIGENADLVVFATPDRVAMNYAAALIQRGIKVIDYSGDFRFSDLAVYNRYAARKPGIGGKPHQTPELLKQSMYGVPELFREKLQNASLVGNPGCFAITIELALAPALRAGILNPQSIIVDGKTGASGGGKKPSTVSHFPEQSENVLPYRVANHQHSAEAEDVLTRVSGSPVGITFVPHQVPTSRGIECACFGQLKGEISPEEIQEIYRKAYAHEPFVRVLPPGIAPGPKAVRGSNLCDISLFVDQANNRLVIISSADNLLKGQAGTALQNINLMLGLEETTGINRVPLYP
ncbi:N-acetyl-gamma-glutamyl-phosphate reductase [Ktedonobacteria bacterium brp13]|nr:N-acetyl-gamma-glutamyl-phosphate reductase [Ktedonobacteria bacterium brp13]